MLKELVEDYMESEWINKKREVSFYRARSELLGFARVHFYHPGTTTSKPVWMYGVLGQVELNPIEADKHGMFKEKIYLIDDYKIEVVHKSNRILITSDNLMSPGRVFK